MKLKFNVAIVGSGLTGNIASLALSKAGYKVALIDPNKFEKFKHKTYDTRTTALSKKSKLFLESLNLWQFIEPHTCIIKNIMVNDGDTKDNIYFKSQNNTSYHALGYMVKNGALFNSLISAIKKNNNITKYDAKVSSFSRSLEDVILELSNGMKIKSNLLIAADGKNSFIRKKAGINIYKKNYNQKAFIFNVKHTKEHNNLATENFLEHGPLASLPITQNTSSFYSSIVWSCNYPFYYKVIKYKKNDIENILNFYLSNYYGKFKIISDIKNWNLSLIKANKFYDTRLLLLGDSAHSIHPLAGQGLNLTLKGIEILYNLAKDNNLKKENLGNDNVLKVFSKKQYLNSITIIFATDKLNFLFSNSNVFLKRIRKIGLNTFKKINILKNVFKNYASEGKLSIK